MILNGAEPPRLDMLLSDSSGPTFQSRILSWDALKHQYAHRRVNELDSSMQTALKRYQSDSPNKMLLIRESGHAGNRPATLRVLQYPENLGLTEPRTRPELSYVEHFDGAVSASGDHMRAICGPTCLHTMGPLAHTPKIRFVM